MNTKKALLFILCSYFLTLFQTSFLIHLNIPNYIPNLVILWVIVLAFFEKSKNFISPGLINAAISGFFLDIFSNFFIGFFILINVGCFLLVRLMFKKYLQISYRKILNN